MWEAVGVKTIVVLCIAGYYGQLTGGIRLVQLVDSLGLTNVSSGCLELYRDDEWTAVCTTVFNMGVADLVCKQLQYKYASAVGTTMRCSSSNNVTSISCSSRALDLLGCLIAPSNCSLSSYVSLTCTNKSSPVRLVSESGRTANLSAGRLEIYIDKQWGTVCDDVFSIADADVACRHMGFEGANSFSSASFIGYELVSSSIPTWLDNLDCSSAPTNRNDLRLCPHAGVGVEDCSHEEDIILSCINPGFLRLNYSSNSKTLRNYGRLEIYWNGVWGTVCYEPSFSTTTALVACRQLGFKGVNCFGTISELEFAVLSNPDIVLEGVSCSSSILATLLDCSYTAIGLMKSSCNHSSDVVLSCTTQSLLGRSICDGDVTGDGPGGGGEGGGGGGGGQTTISSIVGAVTTLTLIATTVAITCIFICITASGATRSNRHSHHRTVVPNLEDEDSDSTIPGGIIPFLIDTHDGYPGFLDSQPAGMQIEPHSERTPTFQGSPPPPYHYVTAEPPAYTSSGKTPTIVTSQITRVVDPHVSRNREGSVSHPTQGESTAICSIEVQDATPQSNQGEGSMTSHPTPLEGGLTGSNPTSEVVVAPRPTQRESTTALSLPPHGITVDSD